MASKQQNQLNEKDSLQDMLMAEKAMVKMYSTALTEASGKTVRTVLKNGFNECVTDQHGLFKTMSDCGYYEPAPADKAVIDKQRDAFIKVSDMLANG